MFGLGTPEIILILLLVLVLFGAKKIPELAKGVGKGLTEFRKATSDIQNEVQGRPVYRDERDPAADRYAAAPPERDEAPVRRPRRELPAASDEARPRYADEQAPVARRPRNPQS